MDVNRATTQYNSNIEGLSAYLSTRQNVLLSRTQTTHSQSSPENISNLAGHRASPVIMVIRTTEQARLPLVASAPHTTQKTQTPEQELVSNLENMAPFGPTPSYQSVQSSNTRSTCNDLKKRISELEAIIARRDEEKSSTKGKNVSTSSKISRVHLSGFGTSSTPGHGFGTADYGVQPSSQPFGSSGFGGPSTPGHGFDSPSKPFGSSGFGTSSTPIRGFGLSSKPFGSPGFGGPSTRDNDSRPFGYGLGIDHRPTQGSNVTGFGTKVSSSLISATEHKPFGTRAYSAALDGPSAFGSTSAPIVDNHQPISDTMSTPTPGDDNSALASAQLSSKLTDASTQSAPAPAPHVSISVNAYLLKAMEQVVVKSEGTIPEMKMLEILVQTHAGLVKGLELAKAERRDNAA